MYLIITADGVIHVADEIDGDDIEASIDGEIDIVDISDPEQPTEYFEGKWDNVTDWKN